MKKKRVPGDGEKETRTEAMVDEVAGELPRRRSQPFRYLSLSLRCIRVPQGWGQGRAGGQAALGGRGREGQ